VTVILDHHWKEWPVYSHYILPIHVIASVAIGFMVCVSLVSAIDYFVAFWSKIDRRGVKRRRRAFILSRRRKPVPPPQADRDVAAST
jgi:CDP-diacylglycerol--glycerol-3-phosphate 3-phosphatidyltransferase